MRAIIRISLDNDEGSKLRNILGRSAAKSALNCKPRPR